MKKLLLSVVSLLTIGIVAAATVPAENVYADTSGEAEAHVYAIVNPNIAVGVLTPIVNAGTVQMGDFNAVIGFRVDANKEDVKLSVCASELYKGDDPTNPTVAPIPLNLSAGVPIAPTDANPMNGASNVANYSGGSCSIGAFPGLATEQIHFESSQNGHFSQDVYVTVTWNQGDPEKPMGEYSGKVKFIAMLVP